MVRQSTHFWLKCLLVSQLICVTIGAYYFWHAQEKGAFHKAFENTIGRNAITIQRRVSALENKLLALRAFYRSSREVDGAEFTTFLESLPLTEFESEQHASSVKLWLWIAADDNLREPSLIASGEDHASSQLQDGAFKSAIRSFCGRLREDLCTHSERQFLMPASFLGAPLDTSHFHHVAVFQPIWHDSRKNINQAKRLRGWLIAITDLGELLRAEPHVSIGYLQGAALLSAPLTVIAAQTMEDARFDLRALKIFDNLEKTSVFSLANGSMSVDWSLSALQKIQAVTPERLMFLLAATAFTLLGWRITNGMQSLNVSLESERDKSQKAVEAKSHFLAKMSHEIRTPLNAIIGMADLINKDRLSAKQQRYLRELNWSAEGLTKLIDDLLDFSKIEAGQITLEALPVELQPFFSHVSNSVAPKFRAKGVVFYLKLHEDLPRHALLDTHRVRQIVLNLLTNAAKFTAQGHVGLLVRPVEEADGTSWIEISVKDTGIGIPDDLRDRIFEKFAQADDSTTRIYGGTGLGLTIVKELVDVMGGRIWVSGEFGAGSTFTVTLPLDALTADQIADVRFMERSRKSELAEQSALASAGAEARPAPRPMRILIAEDDRINRMYMKELIRSMGHESTFAHNGLEAVDLASSRSFDIILMDCQMPLCDGYEATRRLRALGAGTHGGDAIILALTANALADERQKCLAAGMNDYLTKPIREPALACAFSTWRQSTGIAGSSRAASTMPSVPAGALEDCSAPRPPVDIVDGAIVTQAAKDHSIEASATVASPACLTGNAALVIDNRRIEDLRQSMGASFPTMLNCFIEDLNTYSSAVLKAFANQNYTEARRIAHSLKSTSLLVGAVGLSDEARALEALLMHQPDDGMSAEIEAKLSTMGATISVVAAELQTYQERQAA